MRKSIKKETRFAKGNGLLMPPRYVYLTFSIIVFSILLFAIFSFLERRPRGVHPCFSHLDDLTDLLEAPPDNIISDDGNEAITVENVQNLSLIYQSTPLLPSSEIFFATFNTDATRLALHHGGARAIVDISSRDIIWSDYQGRGLATFEFTSDNILLSVGTEGVINLHDNSLIIEYTLRLNESIRDASVNPNNVCFAFGSNRNKVKFVILDGDNTRIDSLNARNGVETVAFSPDGRWFAYGTSGDNDSNGSTYFSLWNLEENEEEFVVNTPSIVSNVVFSPEANTIAISYRSRVDIYNVNTQEVIQTFANLLSDSQITAIIYNHINDILVTGNEDGLVSVWSLENGVLLTEYDIGNEIVDLAFTTGDRLLLVVNRMGQLGYLGVQ